MRMLKDGERHRDYFVLGTGIYAGPILYIAHPRHSFARTHILEFSLAFPSQHYANKFRDGINGNKFLYRIYGAYWDGRAQMWVT